MRATSCLVLAVLGCAPEREVATVQPQQDKIETKIVPSVPNKDVDILFVIDDSGSMMEEQESLRANFPRFIGILDSIPGGRPNVQIGVVTPNLGTTAIAGDAAPTLGTCTASGGERGELRPLAPGGPRFLRDVALPGGGRETNYGAGSLAEAFSELAAVGASGCGVEQHLEAMKRALDDNPVNAGFVRDAAYLAVIVIADEDDCSLASSTIFDGDRTRPGYGEAVNFRCTTEGVACETPATPLGDAAGRRTDCYPREDSAVVAPIDRYVEFLQARKGDPERVIVAGIVGDPEPFQIVDDPDTGARRLGSSCPAPAGAQVALPAVRTSDFLAQFPNQTRTTICDADLSDGLEQIAVLLRRTILDACFLYTLADADPGTAGMQYDCSVTEMRRIPNRPDVQLGVIPSCAGGTLPCWRIEADPVECDFTQTHMKLVIDRGGEVPGPDIYATASCVTADAPGPLQ